MIIFSLWLIIGMLVILYLGYNYQDFPFLNKIDKLFFLGFILASISFPLVIAKFYLHYRK